MPDFNTVGLDLAKSVFQVHGADAGGRVMLRKKLRRAQMLDFFATLPACVVAMEACGGAHFWGRELAKHGHEVRLIPPAYVKLFVKRQKNDAADAEAICEAAERPSMRFVPIKNEETQGAANVFRVRELLIRQRTQSIDALRGRLCEYGHVVPQGMRNVGRLVALIGSEAADLPATARAFLDVLPGILAELDRQIAALDAEIERRARESQVVRRLMTIPGVGPLIATALATLPPLRRSSAKAATLPHGSGSRRGSIQRVGNSGLGPRPGWVSGR